MLNRRNIYFFITALVCVAVLIIVSSKFVFLDGDSIKAFYPYARSIQEAGSGIWESDILSGHSLATSFQIGIFSPVYRIFILSFGFISGYNLLIFFYLLITFVFTYIFCRSLKFSNNASLFSAVTFSLSQIVMHWAGNLAITSAIPVIPAAFIAIRGAIYGQKWHLIISFLFLGLSFLGAHQQLILMSLAAAFFYGIYLSVNLYAAGSKLHKIAGSWLVFFLGCIVSFIIGLPQLFYTWRFTPLSTRVGGLDWASASAGAATPFDLIKYILPDFSFRYWISGEYLPYIGILPLSLALFAVVRRYKNEHVLFFGGLAVLSSLLSVKYPLFWLMHKLPILEYFRVPARWVFILTYSLAILAGIGFDFALTNLDDAKKFIKKFVGILFAFVMGASLLSLSVFTVFGSRIISFLQAFFDNNLYQNTTKLPLEYYHNLISKIINDSFANLSFSKPGFLFAVLIISCSFLAVKFSDNTRKFTKLIFVVTIINLVVFGYMGLVFTSANIFREPPPLASYLKQVENNPFSYRVFTFFVRSASSQKIAMLDNGEYEAMIYGVDSLIPSSNIFWNIQSIDGYEPMAPRRGQRMLAFVGSEITQFAPSLANTTIPLSEKFSLFLSRIPLLSMMNVKYIISGYELPKTNNLGLVHTVYSTKFNVPIYLYKNTKVLPRIYLANSVTILSSNDEVKNFEMITDPTNDFSKTIYLECGDCLNSKNLPSDKDRLSINKYQNGLLELSASINRGRWLIFSESNLPGWQATIDSEFVPIYTANYLFQGVYIPAGEHSIKFEYK